MPKIILGDQVLDPVTGFKGIAVCRHSYLQGCDRISIQPKVDKEGSIPDSQSFDEPQLVVIKSKVIPQGQTTTGGPEKYMPQSKTTGSRK